jgi:serine/threonine-protein kinase
VLDFGLVKEADDEESTRGKGKFCGTPAFMAPEQAFRYNEVDARSDIYAIGAVAYYLLSGRLVFSNKNVIELIAAHANDPVPPLASLGKKVAPDIETIVMRCLAKQPDDRYYSAQELHDALLATGLHKGWDSTQAKTWWQSHS